MFPVTCPYPGCGWDERYDLERPAEIIRELHVARCRKKPYGPYFNS